MQSLLTYQLQVQPHQPHQPRRPPQRQKAPRPVVVHRTSATALNHKMSVRKKMAHQSLAQPHQPQTASLQQGRRLHVKGSFSGAHNHKACCAAKEGAPLAGATPPASPAQDGSTTASPAAGTAPPARQPQKAPLQRAPRLHVIRSFSSRPSPQMFMSRKGRRACCWCSLTSPDSARRPRCSELRLCKVKGSISRCT